MSSYKYIRSQKEKKSGEGNPESTPYIAKYSKTRNFPKNILELA